MGRLDLRPGKIRCRSLVAMFFPRHSLAFFPVVRTAIVWRRVAVRQIASVHGAFRMNKRVRYVGAIVGVHNRPFAGGVLLFFNLSCYSFL
jgi:hypothetical protein